MKPNSSTKQREAAGKLDQVTDLFDETTGLNRQRAWVSGDDANGTERIDILDPTTASL